MAGYRSTRSARSDMAKSLERDPQLESLLANHKKALGIQVESGRRLGAELAGWRAAAPDSEAGRW